MMQGIIYEIYIDSHPDIRYVGSTLQTLEKRWQRHKNRFKEEKKKGPVICKYFEKFGVDNFQIRVIKEYEVVDRKHLLAYEQLWINNLKTINIVKNLFRLKKIKNMQRKLNYKNKESEKKKLYHEKNRESIRERKQRKYICPCNLLKEICHGEKARHEKSTKHQKYLQSLEETKE